MFIGHYNAGLAFNRQKNTSKTTFFVLELKKQFVGPLWGLFTLLDIEGSNSGSNVENNIFRNSKRFGPFGLINQNKL